MGGRKKQKWGVERRGFGKFFFIKRQKKNTLVNCDCSTGTCGTGGGGGGGGGQSVDYGTVKSFERLKRGRESSWGRT